MMIMIGDMVSRGDMMTMIMMIDDDDEDDEGDAIASSAADAPDDHVDEDITIK